MEPHARDRRSEPVHAIYIAAYAERAEIAEDAEIYGIVRIDDSKACTASDVDIGCTRARLGRYLEVKGEHLRIVKHIEVLLRIRQVPCT